MIIFTKGADIFGHVYIYIYILGVTPNSQRLDASIEGAWFDSQSHSGIFFFLFFCHIHNYTEYNQQWNVFSAFNHPNAHTWSSGQLTLRLPGSSWGFRALLKGLTSVVDNSCQSQDSNQQPRVTSPTLYLLGHDCPHDFVGCYDHAILAIMGCSMSDFTYNYQFSPNKFMYSLLWQCFKWEYVKKEALNKYFNVCE